MLTSKLYHFWKDGGLSKASKIKQTSPTSKLDSQVAKLSLLRSKLTKVRTVVVKGRDSLIKSQRLQQQAKQTEDRLAAAALTIQAHVRGFLTRTKVESSYIENCRIATSSLISELDVSLTTMFMNLGPTVRNVSLI